MDAPRTRKANYLLAETDPEILFRERQLPTPVIL